MTQPFMQAQAEGLCLRYPENLGLHREVTYDLAVNMLMRATTFAQTYPFSWGYVDKPAEGQVLLLFIPLQNPFPNDGIRWQDTEINYSIPVGGGRDLEVKEQKFGFIPGSSDGSAWRLRRRYRLNKGGHPQLVLVHYTRGPQAPIIPTLMNTPVRPYPLRPVQEPPVYIAGEKSGQKVYPPNSGPPSQGMPPSAGMPGQIGMNQIAHQNSQMEMLERRRERETRGRSGSTAQRPPRIEDDDSGDEGESISTRTLALTRYRRNHDFMNEVFKHAAYGDKHAPPPPPPYKSVFEQSDLDEKAAKLTTEIEDLHTRAAERKAARTRIVEQQADVSMESGA